MTIGFAVFYLAKIHHIATLGDYIDFAKFGAPILCYDGATLAF